jgi:hypothetical protein
MSTYLEEFVTLPCCFDTTCSYLLGQTGVTSLHWDAKRRGVVFHHRNFLRSGMCTCSTCGRFWVLRCFPIKDRIVTWKTVFTSRIRFRRSKDIGSDTNFHNLDRTLNRLPQNRYDSSGNFARAFSEAQDVDKEPRIGSGRHGN